MVFPDYFKIGSMYLSKYFVSFERYVSRLHFIPLHVLLYQLLYVLKWPRTKKVEKSCKPVETTLHGLVHMAWIDII
jgi:hypothetical protein